MKPDFRKVSSTASRFQGFKENLGSGAGDLEENSSGQTECWAQRHQLPRHGNRKL